MSAEDYIGKHAAPDGFVPDLVRVRAQEQLTALFVEWLPRQRVEVDHNGMTYRIFPTALDATRIQLGDIAVVVEP